MSEPEIWKDVPGYNCEVAADGRCRLARATKYRAAGTPLTRSTNGVGATVVLVPAAGESKAKPVRLARLVLLAHSGAPPVPRWRIEFLDGDDENTSADNLRWALPKTTGRRKSSRPASSRRGGMIRACMTCGESFDSEGPHNRLCDRCRDTADDYMSAPFPRAVGLRR